MATTTEIREALASTLDGIAGAHVYAYESDHPVSPALMVSTYSADYDLVMGSGTTYDFKVFVVIGGAIDRSYQERLDAFLSPTGSSSLKATIDAAPTLGAVVDFAAVRQVDSSLVAMEFAGVPYACATVTVEVISRP